jgi:uncharacterized coiled-coil protein SlyX
MDNNELTLEQRIELVDIELAEIAKILEELSTSMAELAKTFRVENE